RAASPRSVAPPPVTLCVTSGSPVRPWALHSRGFASLGSASSGNAVRYLRIAYPPVRPSAL
ncbi:MAG: hypothetical protein OEZ54_07100, partial [Gemmatimonadota bacterium]|nr:hypothetical protein [Gemmatimonadota bacterium]